MTFKTAAQLSGKQEVSRLEKFGHMVGPVAVTLTVLGAIAMELYSPSPSYDIDLKALFGGGAMAVASAAGVGVIFRIAGAL